MPYAGSTVVTFQSYFSKYRKVTENSKKKVGGTSQELLNHYKNMAEMFKNLFSDFLTLVQIVILIVDTKYFKVHGMFFKFFNNMVHL